MFITFLCLVSLGKENPVVQITMHIQVSNKNKNNFSFSGC